MSKTSSPPLAAEDTVIRVMEAGQLVELDYDGALTRHVDSLWWGTAVAFRAMQAVALAMSKDELWNRDDLYVVTAHPGGGVADAVDYVTRAVERRRFKVIQDGDCGMRCNSMMRYDWWVSDGRRTAAVQLRHGFVPGAFYSLMDRLGKPDTTAADRRAFELFKVNLSAKVWVAPLEKNFTVEVTPVPLSIGEQPEVTLASDYWTGVREWRDAAESTLPV